MTRTYLMDAPYVFSDIFNYEKCRIMALCFQDLLPYLNMMWSAPLQIALCTWLMWVELGNAIFAGFAIMVLAIPINALVGAITKKLQITQMKNKDDRVKLMNELLGGMKVLKLYGWEPSFSDQVP